MKADLLPNKLRRALDRSKLSRRLRAMQGMASIAEIKAGTIVQHRSLTVILSLAPHGSYSHIRRKCIVKTAGVVRWRHTSQEDQALAESAFIGALALQHER